MVSENIKEILKNSILKLQQKKVFPKFEIPEIEITLPENPSFGDFSSNVAFLVSKFLKKEPFEVAKLILKESNWEKTKIFEKAKVAMPGFINFFLSKSFLIEQLKEILRKKEKYGKSKIGKGKKIVVDYSSPNVAKKFGIGHLRSTIIGQTICNIYKFLGFKVIGDNHVGDWGTQFGEIIFQIKRKRINPQKMSVEEMEKIYVEFNREAQKNPALFEEGKKWFEKLEKGDKQARKIWKICVKKSSQEFDKIYKILGIKFDFVLGESFYEKMAKKVIKEALEKKVAKESQGAIIVEFERMPPAILLKSDKTTTYFARDLACAKYRLKRWKPNLIIYEVGAEQALHFRQLFETIERLGWAKREKFYHLAHGLYRLKEGKFSTRKGLTIHLEDVLKEAIERAKEIIEKSQTSKILSEKEKKEVAKIVGIGAIKYNDLKMHPSSDIVFDWEKILNLKGNSAPYLQYTFVRAKSVLEKGKFKKVKKIEWKNLNQKEIEILRHLCKFPFVVELAAKNFSPNLICDFAFKLAQKYNLFYDQYPILKSEKKEQRIFRLALSFGVAQVLKNSLNLLSISVPERM